MQEALGKLGININVTFSFVFFSLLWIRVLAMASIVPFLFGKPVPKSIVTGASAALAIYLYPLLVPSTPPDLEKDFFLLFMLYLKEGFYGLVIGFVASIIFYAFQCAGSMIDSQRGLSIARSILPQLGTQVEVSGIFLFQFAIVLYLTFGGHLIFLDTFLNSYVNLPLLEFPTVGPGLYPLVDLVSRVTAEVFYISIQIAAPIIIVIFVSDVILGVANRIAPQIDVWMLGFNLKGYVGILLLFAAIGMIGDQVYNYTLKSESYLNGTIRYLKGDAPPVEGTDGAVEAPYPDYRPAQPVITK